MKPLIGITCNLEEKTIAGINKRNFHDLALTYTQAIQESGGIPLIIPNSLSPEEAIIPGSRPLALAAGIMITRSISAVRRAASTTAMCPL